MPTSPPPGAPPHPDPATPRHEFGTTLRALRTWAGLTQKALEDRDDQLSDSTISEHERGTRWPRWEWVYVFVTACLRHRMPDASLAALDAELAPWRKEWGRLNKPDTLQAVDPNPPAASPPGVTDTPAALPPALPPSQEPGTAQRSRDNQNHAQTWRRIAGGAALLLAIGGMIAAATAQSEVPVRVNATVHDLKDGEGIDLDAGTRNPNKPGIDVRFSASSALLYAASTEVSVAVLPEPLTTDWIHCHNAVSWFPGVGNIYDLAPGRNICVKTDENRLSMLTITEQGMAATGAVNFRYTTWDQIGSAQ
jgi:hypothetical protein